MVSRIEMIGLIISTRSTSLRPADSPVVPPAPWVGLSATALTRQCDLQLSTGEVPRRRNVSRFWQNLAKSLYCGRGGVPAAIVNLMSQDSMKPDSEQDLGDGLLGWCGTDIEIR